MTSGNRLAVNVYAAMLYEFPALRADFDTHAATSSGVIRLVLNTVAILAVSVFGH